MLTEEQLMQAMSKVTHPEIDYGLVDLGMIKDVRLEPDKIAVTVNLPFLAVPIKDELARLVTEAVATVDEILPAEVQFGAMSEEERGEFMRKAQEKWKL